MILNWLQHRSPTNRKNLATKEECNLKDLTAEKEGLLKVKDVARILNISMAKAYELTQSQKLPVVKIDKCIRVRREDLEEWICQNTTREPEKLLQEVK